MRPVQPGYLRRPAPGPVWTEREVEIVRAARGHWNVEQGVPTPGWLLDWIHFIVWYEYLWGPEEAYERMLYDTARTGRQQAGAL